MKALLLVAAISSANPVAEMPVEAGGSIRLYDDSANCNYGWSRGDIVNSAKLTVSEFCWRLNRSTGQIIFDNGYDAYIEQFNLSAGGLAWIRSEVL